MGANQQAQICNCGNRPKKKKTQPLTAKSISDLLEKQAQVAYNKQT